MSTWNPQDPDNARRHLPLAQFAHGSRTSRTQRINTALLVAVMVLGGLTILFILITNSF